MSRFSDMLTFLRKRAGLSQEELAARLDVSRSTIGMYESGKREPSFETMELIADVFNVNMDTLMGRSDTSLPSNVTPLDLAHLKRIPILGRIACGKPIIAEEYIEGYTYTDLNGGSVYFALRVRGDSMNAARINEDDIVIVRQQDAVDNGQIAVVLVDGEDATLKRFRQDGYTVTLTPQSTNPEHQTLVYDTRRTPVRILGLVVRVEFSPK